MKTSLLIFYFLLTIFFYSTYSIAIDDFHCKIPTCRDFYYGLKSYPRRNQYERICFDTVYRIQAIPRKYGTCVLEDTGKLNRECIIEVANTIKACIEQLYDVPDREARYYCGYTLMKYCAVHVGLDGYPLNFT